MPDRTTLLVTCEKEAVEPLLLALRAYDVDAQASGQRNLDGASITSWLVVAGLAVKMAPEILRSLAELVEKVRFRAEPAAQTPRRRRCVAAVVGTTL